MKIDIKLDAFSINLAREQLIKDLTPTNVKDIVSCLQYEIQHAYLPTSTRVELRKSIQDILDVVLQATKRGTIKPTTILLRYIGHIDDFIGTNCIMTELTDSTPYEYYSLRSSIIDNLDWSKLSVEERQYLLFYGEGFGKHLESSVINRVKIDAKLVSILIKLLKQHQKKIGKHKCLTLLLTNLKRKLKERENYGSI